MKDLYSILCATIIILANSFYGFAQKTTYYFSPNTGEDKGQFITFVGDICFESNKAGKSVGHGNLQINQYQSNNSQTVYVGKSYWGDNTKFIFNPNKSEMTVRTSDGRTFCYQQKMPPANLTTCALIKTPTKSGNSDSPLYQGWGNGYNGSEIRGTNSNNNSTRNGEGTHSRGTQPRQMRQFKCAYCNGTGRIERNDNAPASFGQTKANKKCNECGKIYDPTVFNHYHVQCGHCGGTGNAK